MCDCIYYRVLLSRIKIENLPEILVNTVVNTATISFLIVTANLFGFIIAYEKIPQLVAESHAQSV